MVSSMVVGKELEESVKMLYKKFVRGEGALDDRSSVAKLGGKAVDKAYELINANRSGGGGPGGGGGDDDSSVVSQDSISGGGAMGRSGGRGGGGAGGTGGRATHTAGGTMTELGRAQQKAFIQDVEDALIDTAKEADRQKKFIERQSANLKHRYVLQYHLVLYGAGTVSIS